MTNMGNSVYRIEVPSGATKIIFNNGSSQTADITIQSMNMIYKKRKLVSVLISFKILTLSKKLSEKFSGSFLT